MVPNAGIPDEEGVYPESPAMLAGILETFVDEGWINVLGRLLWNKRQLTKELSSRSNERKPRELSTLSVSRISQN